MIIPKKIIITIALLLSYTVYSQSFTELDTTRYAQNKELKKFLSLTFENFNNNLSEDYSRKLKKALIPRLKKNQSKIMDNLFLENQLIYNTKFNDFLETSIDSIKHYNPKLKNIDYKILLSRSPSPNAYSVGYNIIVVNMGLFKYLKNKYQVMSVLLHEIAHDFKAHGFNSTLQSVNKLHSKETKRDLEDLNKERYNRGGLAFQKLKELVYFKSLKNKKQELEADAVGFKFYSNSNWPKASYVNVLERLKDLENASEFTLDSTIYKRLFDLKEQPFKKEWLKKEDFSAYNYSLYKDKMDKDSISSHPETDNRIATLKSISKSKTGTVTTSKPELKSIANSNSINTSNPYIEASKEFKKLKKDARWQQIANLYYLKEYGASLYSTLIMLEDYPNSKYLLKYIGLNFKEIHNAQKEYKLNRYVEQLNPNEQSNSYFNFLNFIWNLSLNEMQIISDHYIEKYANN